MNDDPLQWWQWLIVVVLMPLLTLIGKDAFMAWRDSRKERIQHDDKVVERRSSRMDAEIDRVLKLKDERIEDLKATLSAKNVELADMLKEVRLCRGEKEEFAKTTGQQAVTLAEVRAELTHVRAELGDAVVEITRLQQDIKTRDMLINQFEEARTGARDALTKLDTPQTGKPDRPNV